MPLRIEKTDEADEMLNALPTHVRLFFKDRIGMFAASYPTTPHSTDLTPIKGTKSLWRMAYHGGTLETEYRMMFRLAPPRIIIFFAGLRGSGETDFYRRVLGP